jgi:hypothetical protein
MIRDLVKDFNSTHFLHDDLSFGVNFDDESLNDEHFWVLTGIKKSDFIYLAQDLKLRGRHWSPRNSLGVFMMKLRMGISHRELSILFKVSVRRVHKRIKLTREAFLRVNGFVDRNLGPRHVTREQLIRDHTTTIARELFGEKVLIVVEDGTYIYIQKSGDFILARHTYSAHKHRPLVKPMILCTTDGYILAVLGPYLADGKNSDACIFVHQFESQTDNDAQSLRELIQQGDIWIVDRGFRGVSDKYPEQTIHMPSFESDGQATADEANHSRRVTKVRFVVECANARLKQFKFLAKTVTNTQLPHVGAYTRIVAAVCNKFRPPLVQSKPEDHMLARRMLAKLHKNNELKGRCSAGGDLFSRSSNVWESLESSHVPGFPLLTESQIEGTCAIIKLLSQIQILSDLCSFPDFITFGIYQIGQAKNYIREHLDSNGDFLLQREKFDDDTDETAARVIHVRLQSRHSSAAKYHTYVQFDPQLRVAWEKIVAWYCTCSCGARTMGCCAHVTTTIWWLSVGRTAGLPKRQNLWVNLVDADLSRSLGQSRFHAEVVRQAAKDTSESDSEATISDVEWPRRNNQCQIEDQGTDSATSEDEWVPTPKSPILVDQTFLSSHVSSPNILTDTPFSAEKTADFIIVVEPCSRSAQPVTLSPVPVIESLKRTTRSSTKKARTEVQDALESEMISSDSDSEMVRRQPKILVRQRFQSLAARVRLQTTVQTFLQTRKLMHEEYEQAILIRKFVNEHYLSFPNVQLAPIFNSFPFEIADLKCLLQSNEPREMWLNASVMNAFMALLVRKYSNAAFLPTFFWQMMESNDSTCITTYWDRMDPLATITFIPINVNNCHWKLCLLNWRTRSASTFDPDSNSSDSVSVLPRLKAATSSSSQFCIQDFLESPLATSLRQPDAFNCGITVLVLAEMVCANLPLLNISFTSQDLFLYRQRILITLAANRLE